MDSSAAVNAEEAVSATCAAAGENACYARERGPATAVPVRLVLVKCVAAQKNASDAKAPVNVFTVTGTEPAIYATAIPSALPAAALAGRSR